MLRSSGRGAEPGEGRADEWGGAGGGPGSRGHLLPCPLGLAAWEEYPTLKMLMEMAMTK